MGLVKYSCVLFGLQRRLKVRNFAVMTDTVVVSIREGRR